MRVRSSEVSTPEPPVSMADGVVETVTCVEGPSESSSLCPSGGVNSTRTVSGPGPTSVTGRSERWAPRSMTRSAALATGTQVTRWAPDSTTISWPMPSTGGPTIAAEGSSRSVATVTTVTGALEAASSSVCSSMIRIDPL